MATRRKLLISLHNSTCGISYNQRTAYFFCPLRFQYNTGENLSCAAINTQPPRPGGNQGCLRHLLLHHVYLLYLRPGTSDCRGAPIPIKQIITSERLNTKTKKRSCAAQKKTGENQLYPFNSRLCNE